MNTITKNSFEIPKGGYVAFDAISLRELIINRLNEQQVFTDQNYIGSNLAAIIDIVAYAYHTLIYYLNKTSTETMFSEAQLYENINRIVKLIDYSPIGYQTSTLSFTCSALQNIPAGTYTIPRYSNVITNNIPFSFNEDITFVKTTNIDESLNELAQQKLLYQGYYEEYPIQTAAGENNEIVILNTTENIDHFNIDVYVKPVLTKTWEQFESTPNLLLESSNAKKYEIRLNGNKKYEIKFGNDINGIKLKTGDQIAVYYLRSSGKDGEIGPNALNNRYTLGLYNSIQFRSILNDVINNNQYNLLDNTYTKSIVFNNTANSTPAKDIETIEEIRKTAPKKYRSQYRLVTANDYEVFVKTNFANLLLDVKCINNLDYISGYLKYFYDIGLTAPANNQLSLYNQVLFADACNFNNIYLIVIPRSLSNTSNFLLPSQKQLIASSLQQNKTATTEIVFVDPIYKAVSFGGGDAFTDIDPATDYVFYELEVVKQPTSSRNDIAILEDVKKVFTTYFSNQKSNLGQKIDISALTQQILNIPGVQTFYTVRNDSTVTRTEGLTLFVWNPAYPDNDKKVITSNLNLQYFEYPYFENIDNITQTIKIV